MFKSPGWAALIDLNLADGVVQAVSRPRLAPYGLGAAGNTNLDVVARHGMNIVLCEALYPVLHMLEVVMRNSIHDTFSKHFGAPDWYDQPWIKEGHAQIVGDAKDELKKRGKPVTPDGVVAELSFGFWCGLFHNAYETGTGPWPVLLSSVLPRVPKSWRTREKVRQRVEGARTIRNRVFHHESIMQYADLFHRHRQLIELLGWFSPEARSHLEHICRFRSVFTNRLELADPI